jgi:hypothetical protein
MSLGEKGTERTLYIPGSHEVPSFGYVWRLADLTVPDGLSDESCFG